MGAPHGLGDAALYPYLLAMREELYTAQRTTERLYEARSRWISALDDPDNELFAGIEAEQDMMGAVELLLTAHTRLSLYLFPAYDRPPARGRGRALRALLAIPDNHPIGNRDARNAWMHVDEHVDRAVFDRGEEYVEAYRVLRTQWPTARLLPRNILTIFNADTLMLRVAGTAYNIHSLNDDIDNVGAALMRTIPDVEHRLDLDGQRAG